jgi:hypothetical protein
MYLRTDVMNENVDNFIVKGVPNHGSPGVILLRNTGPKGHTLASLTHVTRTGGRIEVTPKKSGSTIYTQSSFTVEETNRVHCKCT